MLNVLTSKKSYDCYQNVFMIYAVYRALLAVCMVNTFRRIHSISSRYLFEWKVFLWLLYEWYLLSLHIRTKGIGRLHTTRIITSYEMHPESCAHAECFVTVSCEWILPIYFIFRHAGRWWMFPWRLAIAFFCENILGTVWCVCDFLCSPIYLAAHSTALVIYQVGSMCSSTCWPKYIQYFLYKVDTAMICFEFVVVMMSYHIVHI